MPSKLLRALHRLSMRPSFQLHNIPICVDWHTQRIRITVPILFISSLFWRFSGSRRYNEPEAHRLRHSPPTYRSKRCLSIGGSVSKEFPTSVLETAEILSSYFYHPRNKRRNRLRLSCGISLFSFLELYVWWFSHYLYSFCEIEVQQITSNWICATNSLIIFWTIMKPPGPREYAFPGREDIYHVASISRHRDISETLNAAKTDGVSALENYLLNANTFFAQRLLVYP